MGDRTQEMDSNTQETGDRTQEMYSGIQETPMTNKERLLSLLRENPRMTLNDVAETIGLTRDGVKKIADKLRAKEILTRKGSTKAGEWVVSKNL